MSRFDRIEISEKQELHILSLNSLYKQLEESIEQKEMSPREKALALTKLEESAMWANKAISLRGKQD